MTFLYIGKRTMPRYARALINFQLGVEGTLDLSSLQRWDLKYLYNHITASTHLPHDPRFDGTKGTREDLKKAIAQLFEAVPRPQQPVQEPAAEKSGIKESDIEKSDEHEESDDEDFTIPLYHVDEPTAEKPDIKEPDYEEEPDEEEPDEEEPDEEEPDEEEPDEEEPGEDLAPPLYYVGEPSIEKPDIKKPPIEKSDIKKPPIEKSDIKKPPIEKPDIEKPDDAPDDSEPDEPDDDEEELAGPLYFVKELDVGGPTRHPDNVLYLDTDDPNVKVPIVLSYTLDEADDCDYSGGASVLKSDPTAPDTARATDDVSPPSTKYRYFPYEDFGYG